jgi:hypothetical protein
MAKLVHATCYFSWDTVDLSAYVKSATLTLGTKTVDMTAMNDTVEVNASTYANWSFEATLYQDYAAAMVDATLNTDVGVSGKAIAWRDTSAVKSATNPQWDATGMLTSYTPVQGSVGEAAMVKITVASVTAMVRNV